MNVTYATKTVGNVEVFYREAGPSDAPVILLLHGFPTSGHMFRNLIPMLADRYHVIAPDLPGFGNTRAPGRDKFAEAYRRDLPNAEVHFLDTGHFALETHTAEIAAYLREFLGRQRI